MKTALKLAPILFAFLLLNTSPSMAQGSPNYDGGFKFSLDEDGSKYLRVISWVQGQAGYLSEESFDTNGNENSQVNFSLRRARVLMFAQIDKNFLILTHFGLNSLNSDALSPTGTGDGSQIFLHGAWAQYNLGEHHSLGGGLHYYNGISRLNSQSTLNMLTLDNCRQSWATLGLTDQFARHLGVFAKGKFDRLQYRLAVNEALVSSLDERLPVAGGDAVYGGKRELGSKKAGKTFAGYFDYHFFDQESNLLPYKVGTYLGDKKVFNLGAGFFLHPKGALVDNGTTADANLEGEDVTIFAVDAFYDTPLSEDGSALTAYAVFQDNNYGRDYLFSAYGTGQLFYGYLGYVFKGDRSKTRFQPYASYTLNNYDAVDDNRTQLGLGLNAYMNGHNSKLTLEYQYKQFGDETNNLLILQAMIYL